MLSIPNDFDDQFNNQFDDQFDNQFDNHFDNQFDEKYDTPFDQIMSLYCNNMDISDEEFYTRFVDMIGTNQDYNIVEITSIFMISAEKHLPVNLLMIVLEKLNILSSEIPVNKYDNYLAACIAYVKESLYHNPHDNTYEDEDKIVNYLNDLLIVFNINRPFIMDDSLTILEYMRNDSELYDLLLLTNDIEYNSEYRYYRYQEY